MNKMPAYRWRDAGRLAALLRKDGLKIAQELEPRMAAVLEEGETMPDLAHLLDVLGRMVVAEWRHLDEKDNTKSRHSTYAFSDRMVLRSDAIPLLRSRVQEVRQGMRSHLDPETIDDILGFKGRTPRGDGDLVQLASRMVRGLEIEKPVPSPAGPIDPAGWAAYLRQPLATASGLLDDIETHTQDTSDSTEKKTEAMRTFDKLFRRVAGVGRIFCRMAGLERSARKLIYGGGRPGEKIKKQPAGPVSVA